MTSGSESPKLAIPTRIASLFTIIYTNVLEAFKSYIVWARHRQNLDKHSGFLLVNSVRVSFSIIENSFWFWDLFIHASNGYSPFDLPTEIIIYGIILISNYLFRAPPITATIFLFENRRQRAAKIEAPLADSPPLRTIQLLRRRAKSLSQIISLPGRAFAPSA
jgi:hypothetical protein